MKSAAFDRRAHPPGAAFSTMVTEDGWALRLMEWPQPADRSPRGSILFANGRGDFVEKYLEALAHWHDLGWAVASFDWRGQGDSRGEIIAGHLDSLDPLVGDLHMLLKRWMAAAPAPHVLIGHSMGGHLALRLIAERHPPIAAAILSAPMIGINASPLPTWLSRCVARTLSLLGMSKRRAWKENERPALAGVSRKRFLTTCAERYEDEMWWKRQQPGFDLGPPSWGWLDAAYRSIARVTPELLKRIDIPVLIIGTDRDRLVSPAAIRGAAALMPKAELVMFADAAHEILRESDPVRVAALDQIDQFLDRHAPR